MNNQGRHRGNAARNRLSTTVILLCHWHRKHQRLPGSGRWSPLGAFIRYPHSSSVPGSALGKGFTCRRKLRLSAAADPQAARRQPQRDRHPRLPHRPRTGHPHRRHLLPRGPLRPAPLQGRRGLPRRQARRADPRLPRHPRHRRPRRASTTSMPSTPATASSPRTPHFARACQRGRHHLRRPARRDPRTARRQGRGPRHRPEGRACRSSPAATSRSQSNDEAQRPGRDSSAIPSSSRRRWAAAAAACASP